MAISDGMMTYGIGIVEIVLYIAFVFGMFLFLRLSKTKFGRYEKMHPIVVILLSLIIPVVFVSLYIYLETVFMVVALVFLIMLISVILGGNKK